MNWNIVIKEFLYNILEPFSVPIILLKEGYKGAINRSFIPKCEMTSIMI